MGRRTDIDWEAIERDYRCGQLSIRQIAERHNVAVSAITRRSKKEEWSRDLSAEVAKQTKAKLIECALSDAHAKGTESAQTIISGVAAAAQANIDVIRSHRKIIGDESARSERLAAKIDYMIDSIDEPSSVMKAVQAHEALVRSRAKLIALEREAYGISTSDDEDDAKVVTRITRVIVDPQAK